MTTAEIVLAAVTLLVIGIVFGICLASLMEW